MDNSIRSYVHLGIGLGYSVKVAGYWRQIMTRKDFQLVAGVLANAKSYMPELQWQRLVIITSEELAQTNPRFDYAKFAEACGWELVA